MSRGAGFIRTLCEPNTPWNESNSDTCLQSEVRQIRWHDGDHRWLISTDHGDQIRARFVAMANGYLQKPKLPGIPGIATFGGHAFHTSRWDYGYTGADLSRLADKRVGIVGTGATAVQCVPHLARAAKHLAVFQRTPSSVDVRANRTTDPRWAASLDEGWQQPKRRGWTRSVSDAVTSRVVG
jgi:cation diffusion facilitator CzcD-associated flavoprotein CzcO